VDEVALTKSLLVKGLTGKSRFYRPGVNPVTSNSRTKTTRRDINEGFSK
jgi:hypothetical protein